jgi:hypothetical protein
MPRIAETDALPRAGRMGLLDGASRTRTGDLLGAIPADRGHIRLIR